MLYTGGSRAGAAGGLAQLASVSAATAVPDGDGCFISTDATGARSRARCPNIHVGPIPSPRNTLRQTFSKPCMVGLCLSQGRRPRLYIEPPVQPAPAAGRSVRARLLLRRLLHHRARHSSAGRGAKGVFDPLGGLARSP